MNSIADVAMLHGVLSRRLYEPHTNISHKKLPLWDDHMAYVRRKPHGKNNFIITSGGWPAGHCYLSQQNEIGVFIYPEFRREGFGLWAVRQMIALAEQRGANAVANINPANAIALRFFQKLGFKERTRTRKQVVLEKSGGKRPISTPAQGSDKSPDPGEQDINMGGRGRLAR